MAFTGTPTVTSLGKNTVRITGISLAAAASGTIGLTGGGAGVSLPANFPSAVDAALSAAGLTMADGVDVRYNRSSSGGTQASHLTVAKQATPFLITLTNPDGANASGSLEIYVQYLHSIDR